MNHTKRSVSKSTIAFSVVILSACLLGTVQAAQRPNVLLVCVDDLRNCLSLDGDPIAKTPNLDRLASSGRYFRSHYVQVPACGPSRCSLLTGRRIIRTWDVWRDDRARWENCRERRRIPRLARKGRIPRESKPGRLYSEIEHRPPRPASTSRIPGRISGSVVEAAP